MNTHVVNFTYLFEKKFSYIYGILARYRCILKENTNVLNIFKIMSYFTCSAPIKWLMDFFSQFVHARHFAGKKTLPGFVRVFFLD